MDNFAVSIKYAATVLGINDTTLRDWCDAGLIKHHRTLGGHRRYMMDDLRELAVQMKKQKEEGSNLPELDWENRPLKGKKRDRKEKS